MKLKTKVLLSFSAVLVLSATLLYFGAWQFLQKGFEQLEKDRVRQQIAHVDQVLNEEIATLNMFTSDWAHWNDAYYFLLEKNPDFVANNVKATALLNSSVNMLSYWNAKGDLRVGVMMDLATKKILPFNNAIKKLITPASDLMRLGKPANGLNGYIQFNKKIMMISAIDVTDSDNLVKPVGTLITGRYLSPEIIRNIETITQTQINLYNQTEIGDKSELASFLKKMVASQTNFYIYQDQENAYGYILIRDLNAAPIALMQVTLNRGIYKVGDYALNSFFNYVAIVGLVSALLIALLIHKIIVGRLEKLNYDIDAIKDPRELKARVNVSGGDEIASVSTTINHMLDTIQFTYKALEAQVATRTSELASTNQLLLQEINDRKQIEQELRAHKTRLLELAHYDQLTALPNRLLFNEILSNCINEAEIKSHTFAILFIDLDHFKHINDALGHAVGDLVLKTVAKRMQQLTNPARTFARLGGDEFILLYRHAENKDEVAKFAEELLDLIAKTIQVGHHELYITASVGVSFYPVDGGTLEDLQKNADTAMYRAKHANRANFQFYSPASDNQSREDLKLESQLHKAIEREELVIYYQPKLSLKSNQVQSVEALLRWQHPQLGLVMPGRFVSLAEETNLIMEIGEWVMREACMACKRWQEQGYLNIHVAVNLSPKQFLFQDVEHIVKSILNETQLKPEFLELEITESSVMNDVDYARAKLAAIKSMGVAISIDDFGTGYSSINYLRQFSVDTLKIDQSLIRNLPDNRNDAGIVKAVLDLAKRLKLKTVAEGVESLAQVEWLAEQQCDLIQGYYLSRPLPEHKLLMELSAMETAITN